LIKSKFSRRPGPNLNDGRLDLEKDKFRANLVCDRFFSTKFPKKSEVDENKSQLSFFQVRQPLGSKLY